jgi:hypothetical protein
MSAPVYQGPLQLPLAAVRSVAILNSSRANLGLEKNQTVVLSEEISFSWGPQPTMRQQYHSFMRRVRRYRYLFECLAQIEHRSNAEFIL